MTGDQRCVDVPSDVSAFSDGVESPPSGPDLSSLVEAISAQQAQIAALWRSIDRLVTVIEKFATHSSHIAEALVMDRTESEDEQRDLLGRRY